MRIGVKAVLALLLLSALSLVPPAKAETITVSLAMPGEPPLSNSNGQPILVAGIWHRITVDLETLATSTIALEASSTSALSWDMTSFYRWERNESVGTWTDPLYDTFIDPSLSSSDGTTLVFYAGVDAGALTGTWRLRVFRDASIVDERLFEVQAPRISYGLSVADFVFRVAPFTEAQISTESTSKYIRLINEGNVPLRLQATFDLLQERLTVTNPDEVAHVSKDARYYLFLSLDPRPPQIIGIEGTARVEVQHIIPSPGAAQIIPSFENEFGVKVIVGRIGYQVEAIGNVIFQTITDLQADYSSMVAWQVFLTGSQQVSMDVTVSGVRLLGVYQGSERLTLPAVITPNPDTELPITVQVMTDIPNIEAQVMFDLVLLATGDNRTFITIINVGPRTPIALQPSHLWLFASLISASVLALVSYNHWRLGGIAGGKREGEGSKGTKPAAKTAVGKAEPGEKKGKSREKAKRKSPGKKRKGKGEKGRPKPDAKTA